MTLPQFLQMLLRRWHIVVGGAVLTLAFAARMLVAHPVYWTKAEVLFVEPGISSEEAYLRWTDETLVPFAASVERAVNAGQRNVRLSSREATLFGIGVRDGYRLELPNAGSQWAPSFPRAVLTIEAVGESPQEVQATYSGVLQRVREEALTLQEAQGVPPDAMVKVVPQSEEPTVGFVGATRRARARSLAATVIVGFAVTIAVAAMWDRWAQRRKMRTTSGEPASVGAAAGTVAPEAM